MASNWDATIPTASTSLRESNPEILANQAALEDAISRNHEFPGDEASTAGEHTVVELQDQVGDPSTPADIIGLYNNADDLYFRRQSDGTIVQLGVTAEIPIPAGTKMLFIQNAAPTGWTFVAENNDRVIINQSTEANGGTTAGTWTISSITSLSHVLSTSEMPVHNHSHTHTIVGFGGNDPGSGSIGRGNNSVSPPTMSTNATNAGGGGSHIHDLPITDTWRPEWVGSITCTKD